MSRDDSAGGGLHTKSFELRDIEMAIVRLRNLAKFHLGPNDSPEAAKYFCLGPARSGTTTMHRAFETVGLRSAHTAGNWPLAAFDAFSDRGDYRPYRTYDRYYRNAWFILNTRPVGAWLKSRAKYRQRPISARAFANMIHRRNRFYAELFGYFRASERFMVVNIHAEGAIPEAFSRMNLPAPEPPGKANASAEDYPFDNYANVCRALEETIAESEHAAPFLIPSLTPNDTLVQLSSADTRLLL